MKCPRFAVISLILLMGSAAKGASWSEPVTLVDAHGRLALGNRLHVVGHIGGNLVHRSLQDDGATWSAPGIISPAASNFPMQYGGLYADGDTVYLITAAGDMGPSSQPLDFRKSTDNGQTWSHPIRITRTGEEIRRANIVISGESVHVFGGQSGAGGYGTGLYYFRSTNGGEDWEPGRHLYANADASARLAVDGTTLHVAFGDKLAPNTFGGRSAYMRSADNGTTWSAPVFIGEEGRQARQQIVAANGQVFAMWQREATIQGDPLPADRLGYNRSLDGGLTWLGPDLLPEGSGVDRNHQQLWLTSDGGLHVSWLHGPTLPSSPTGYMYSPDYGSTWLDSETALSTPAANLPHSMVADQNWVHILAEPGAGTYARRPVILSGDYNGNGIVDSADYVVWRKDLGSATNLIADGNNNSIIDEGDYDMWRMKFGSISQSTVAARAAAVPEPHGLMLPIAVAMTLGLRRTCRQHPKCRYVIDRLRSSA